MSVNSLAPRQWRSASFPSSLLWVAMVLCTLLMWRLTFGTSGTAKHNSSISPTRTTEHAGEHRFGLDSSQPVAPPTPPQDLLEENSGQGQAMAAHTAALRAAAVRHSTLRAQLMSTFVSRHPPMTSIRKQSGVVPPPAAASSPVARLLFNASLTHTGDYGWRFVKYLPSELEVAFTESLDALSNTLGSAVRLKDRESLRQLWQQVSAPFKERSEALLRELPRAVEGQLFAARSGVPRDSTQLADCDALLDRRRHERASSSPVSLEGEQSRHPLLSRMVYEFTCLAPPCREADATLPHRVGDVHASFIEPLVGPLQHPVVFLELTKGSAASASELRELQRESFLLTDRWALHNLGVRWRRDSGIRDAHGARHAPKQPATGQLQRVSHVFDIGAGASFRHGSSSWLVRLASSMCVPPTEIRCWEATPVRASTYWKTVPEPLHPKVFWNNFPPSTNPFSWNNPLNHLISEVIIGDPVFLKIRMDSVEAESMLVEQLRTTPDAYQRVDELFLSFSFSWENAPRSGEPRRLLPVIDTVAHLASASPSTRKASALCNVSCIIRTVQQFRSVGVRGHVW